MFKLLVGLANFEVKYFQTRHNVGAWYIQKLMAHNNVLYLKKEEKFSGYIGELTSYNSIVKLLIPTTYMNNSGVSVLAIADFYQFSLDEILIIHDELDLYPGNVRLKFSGGHNGHNGVKDIIKKFKSNNFHRLRIGIGRPQKKDLIPKFVLSEPPLDEKRKINKLIDKLVIYTEVIILKKFEIFMKYIIK